LRLAIPEDIPSVVCRYCTFRAVQKGTASAGGLGAAAANRRQSARRRDRERSLWLHKDKELAYCNANNREGQVLCWKLREPLKGQARS
jgi:hypothetical protein